MRSAELVAPERPVGTGAAQWGHHSKVVNNAVTGVGATVGAGLGVVYRTVSSASAPAAAVPSYDGAAPVAAPVVIPVEPAAAAESAPPSLDGHHVYHAIKVAFEWSLAVLMLASTAPLVALLAALVKLTSSGPAFYLQTRLGKGGKAFRICKLRTMAHNCEAATGPVWASKEDPRVTPIGRLLRDTHLDELPQLWNVVRGDMGLIGPRPERPEIVARIERALPGYHGRLLVRPGVTGLAQMRVPADTGLESVRQKLAHDLYYIQHLGFLLDLRIAVCTFFFFAHLACEAVCSAVVGSYGREVESRLGDAAEVAKA